MTTPQTFEDWYDGLSPADMPSTVHDIERIARAAWLAAHENAAAICDNRVLLHADSSHYSRTAMATAAALCADAIRELLP